MNTIRRHAEDYLAMRRALGFKLTTFGQRLLSFVDYLEAHDLNAVTTDAALAWATATLRSRDEVHWSRRLMVVRVFARHLAVLDPATEIPPPDMLPHHYRRVTPHLYSPDEITALLHATDTLRPTGRALTWCMFIGLLTVTGLRTSEACRLDRADVDLDERLLTVRDSKFRQVPAGPDPPVHRDRAGRLPRHPGPAPDTGAHAGGVRLHPWNPPGSRQPCAHIRPTDHRRGHPNTGRATSPAPS